ncbi:hypothetical protein FKM82_000617 [Ascaphus truei]
MNPRSWENISCSEKLMIFLWCLGSAICLTVFPFNFKSSLTILCCPSQVKRLCESQIQCTEYIELITQDLGSLESVCASAIWVSHTVVGPIHKVVTSGLKCDK